MPKKRNCRRTPYELRQHETAVKIRKMTDRQLCEFIDGLSTATPQCGGFLPLPGQAGRERQRNQRRHNLQTAPDRHQGRFFGGMNFESKRIQKICKSCGYANKDTVEEYCRGKHEFGDEDFLAVYRLQNRKNDAADRTLHGKWHMVDGVKTTKCYQNKGSDKQ